MAVDDADLVLAARSGDRAAWAGIYDRYADRLHDFCWSVLRDRDEAADAMHDTFITAYRKIDQLRDPDRLRPWLFAIARNEALSHGRRQKRAVPTEELEVTAVGGGPSDVAESAELRDLVWSAAAGLAERDRAALDLHLRQGLEGAALGEALGTSADNANVLMSRLRDQVERALGAFLVARRGPRDCAGLDALLKGWDNEFTPLWRKRIARHVDDCPTCDEHRRRMVSPLALLAAAAFVPAPAHLRDKVLNDLHLISTSKPIDDARRRRRRAAGALVAAIVLLLGILILRNNPESTGNSRLATATTSDVELFLPAVGDDTSTTSGEVGDTIVVDDPSAPNPNGGVSPATTAPKSTATTAPPTATTLAPSTIAIKRTSAPSQACKGNGAGASATTSGGASPVMATLYWRGGGYTNAHSTMVGGPTDWSGTFASFTQTGTVTWWVIATDANGASAISAQKTLTVVDCSTTTSTTGRPPIG